MKINLSKIKAKDLIWEKNNREHIKKHNLNPRQVEQVFLDDYLIYYSAYGGRLVLIG